MSFKTNLRTFYALLILPSFLHAQQAPGGSSSRIDRWPIVNIAEKQLASNLRLFTGAEYIRNGQHAQGSPFFLSELPMDGSVLYDGVSYEHVPLQYDLVTGEVVAHDSAGDVNISLVRDNLPRFSLSGRRFIWLPAAGDSDRSISSSYYELLVDGRTPLLARHEKRLFFPITREDAVKYVATDIYFVRLNDKYIRVDGRRSLLNALADKKDQLKKFIRQHDLNFSKDLENALQQVTAFYNQLNFTQLKN